MGNTTMQEGASFLKIFLPCKIYRTCWRIVKSFQLPKVANMSLYIHHWNFIQKYLHGIIHFTVLMVEMVQCDIFIKIPHHNEHMFPALPYPVPWASFQGTKVICILKPSLWVNYVWDSSKSWTKVNPDILPTINKLDPPSNNRTKPIIVTTNHHNLVTNKNVLNHFLNNLESKPIHLQNVRQHHYMPWSSRITHSSKQAPLIMET